MIKAILASMTLLLSFAAHAETLGNVRFYGGRLGPELQIGSDGERGPFYTADFIPSNQDVVANLPAYNADKEYDPRHPIFFICEGRQYGRTIFELKNCVRTASPVEASFL